MIQIKYKGEVYSYKVDGKTPIWLSSSNIIAPMILQGILRKKAIAEGLSLPVKTKTAARAQDTYVDTETPVENTTKVCVTTAAPVAKKKKKSRKVPVSSARGRRQGKYKILIVQPQ